MIRFRRAFKAISLAALVAVSAGPVEASASAPAAVSGIWKGNKRAAKGQGKRHRPRNGGKAEDARASRGKGKKTKRDVRAGVSIKLTRLVLRAAARSVKKNNTGRDRLAVAALHQKAAKLALGKGKSRAALWLTREARQRARDVIRQNRASEPANSGDRPNEWARASKQGAAAFVAMARKMRPSKETAAALADTSKRLRSAAKTVKESGEGKAELRKAIKWQKAARKAGSRGKDKAALALTRKAGEAADEILAASSSGDVEASAGAGEELAGDEYSEADEYLEDADEELGEDEDEDEDADEDYDQ